MTTYVYLVHYVVVDEGMFMDEYAFIASTRPNGASLEDALGQHPLPHTVQEASLVIEEPLSSEVIS